MTYSSSLGFLGSFDTSVTLMTNKNGEIYMMNRNSSLVFPAGSFHGGESIPQRNTSDKVVLPQGTFHGGESVPQRNTSDNVVLPQDSSYACCERIYLADDS